MTALSVSKALVEYMIGDIELNFFSSAHCFLPPLISLEVNLKSCPFIIYLDHNPRENILYNHVSVYTSFSWKRLRNV